MVFKAVGAAQHGARPPKLIGDFNGWDLEHALELTEAAPKVWEVWKEKSVAVQYAVGSEN